MTKVFRPLTIVLFLSALLSIAVLFLADACHAFTVTPLHQTVGALALIFIGSSYVCLQLSARRSPVGLLKGLLLGLAFVLWGGEQFLPPGRLVTAMDASVITIFVVDLSLIIAQHLKQRDHETP